MSNQYNLKDWHMLADRFIWYDSQALSEIPEEISNDEIKRYLYMFHGDNMTVEEIAHWRKAPGTNEQ